MNTKYQMLERILRFSFFMIRHQHKEVVVREEVTN